MLLDRLRDLWSWHEIRGCPGRFVVSKSGDYVTPEMLIGMIVQNDAEKNLIRTAYFRREKQDDVFVAVFLDEGGGGVITFCKSDGKSFAHTLNEPEGLERKLIGLGYDSMLDEKKMPR